MKGGDAIAFCRGGKFTLSTVNPPGLYNPNCSATNPCRIEDYYQVDATKTAKPFITNTKGGVFKFQDPGDPDKDGGYLVKNLYIKGGGIGEGVFIHNDVDDLTIDNLTIEGFEEGIQAALSNTITSANVNGQNDRLIIKNSSIINNLKQGFLGSCNDCLIEGNKFDNNGFSMKIFTHNIYFGGKNSKKCYYKKQYAT
ncbi:hypothetical protein VZ94_17645 [Methylocucumis oryzae]|uniref:Right handed beta helix domain-containing protein n=2 Tax=Methylocucumis oryzae TaxID=1632867 RepID=A0A0F3IFH5_9GAMM|nr:hypothetical protein VZ94_17645 [Methylocucumis oryzae]